ncbi:hypothetical protein IKF94_02820, partial [Candidatus Saccharibacteria bacterium]|nr:hypothetical protein [Candidatus Saccharibacteria bacterium]
LVKVLKGTANSDEIESLANSLGGYIGEYSDYETNFGVVPQITEQEFNVIKENIPKLIKAIGPLLVADAQYTRSTYGEDYSLYYGYSLVSNFNALIYGHTPESIMPLLKATIPSVPVPKTPNTGRFTNIL